MKRLLCGPVVLATSLVLVSCNGDPTGDFRNGPTRILADPSTVFVDQADVEEVVVSLVDDQGDPLPGTWEIVEPGAGITVERNPDFLGTTVGAPLESQAQFVVTAADAPTATSFTIQSGELSLEIPVNVTPTAIATAAFSNATPAASEPVTLTAEGYSFLPTATVTFPQGPGIILANDGASLTFIPVPGSTGAALIDGIAINFLPTTPLSLSTTSELTAGTFAGTESPATAPEIPVPAVGDSIIVYDDGTFTAPDITGDGGVGAQYYRFTVTEAGDYRFVTNWVGEADLDPVVCFDTACADGAFAGTGVDHPEEGTLTLAAGTYYFATVLFSGAAEPFTLTISR